MRPFGARHAVGEPTICAGDLEAAVAARASRTRPPDPRDRLPLVPFQAEFGARVGAVRQPLVGPPRRSGRGLGRLDVVGEDAGSTYVDRDVAVCTGIDDVGFPVGC